MHPSSTSDPNDDKKEKESPANYQSVYRAKCDESDDKCRKFTGQFLDGDITEEELRGLILVEITELRVVHNTIPFSYTPEWRDEATTRLEDIVVRRFMETGEEAFFDFNRAMMKNSSFIGAARNLCTIALKTVNRDIASSRRRNGVTMSAFEIDSSELPENVESVESAEETTMSLLGWGLNNEHADNILDTVRTIRTGNQREVTTRALLKMHALPDLVRLPVADRRHLMALIASETEAAKLEKRGVVNLAYSSLCYLHDLRSKEQPRVARPDEAMLSLWDDYNLADLERVRELNPRVAEAFVLDAISDRARPSRSVIREFTRSIVSSGSGRGWRTAANALARVYIATECDAIAACDSTKGDAESIEQRLAGREMMIATEKQVYSQLFEEHGDSVFGRDIDDVKAKLSVLLDRCTGLEEILRAGLSTLKL
jgi:hypothetical protein